MNQEGKAAKFSNVHLINLILVHFCHDVSLQLERGPELARRDGEVARQDVELANDFGLEGRKATT